MASNANRSAILSGDCKFCMISLEPDVHYEPTTEAHSEIGHGRSQHESGWSSDRWTTDEMNALLEEWRGTASVKKKLPAMTLCLGVVSGASLQFDLDQMPELGGLYVHVMNDTSNDRPVAVRIAASRRCELKTIICNHVALDLQETAKHAELRMLLLDNAAPADGSMNGLLELIASEMPRLETLQLRGMHIDRLPESFQQLKRLKHIALRSNQLASIPASLGAMPALRWANLSDNPITRCDARLEQLLLDNNGSLHLHGTRLPAVPAEISAFQDAWARRQAASFGRMDENGVLLCTPMPPSNRHDYPSGMHLDEEGMLGWGNLGRLLGWRDLNRPPMPLDANIRDMTVERLDQRVSFTAASG